MAEERTYWLKVCPFCGSAEVYVGQAGFPHQVFCLKCGANVKSLKMAKYGEIEAVDKWNKRCNACEAATIVRVLNDEVSE